MEGLNTPSTSSEFNPLDYGYVKDGKVYLKAYRTFPDRAIGEVKTTEEAAIQYFVNRYHFITDKVDKLLADIETAQNKGSYLMKLIHMREHLGEFAAIGNFEPLYLKLDQAEEYLRELISHNRVKNLDIKKALLDELKTVIAEVTDWKSASEKVKEIKEKWLKTGSVAQDSIDSIEGVFQEALDDFYQRRKNFFEERIKVMHERIALYTALVERAKPLAAPDMHPGAAMKEFKSIVDDWKQVGPIPKLHFAPLADSLKDIRRAITRRMKTNQLKRKPFEPQRPLTPEQRMALDNLKAKEELIQQAVALQQIDLRDAYGKAKDLQNRWRTIGNVPETRKRDVNDRFTYACDRIFEMSYLMRTVYVNHRFFNTKPIIEQYAVKIKTMQEIIRKDEAELSGYQAEYDALGEEERRAPQHKPLYTKLSTQKRKLRVKNQLLKEMSEQMEAL